jgi:hypothetical protein
MISAVLAASLALIVVVSLRFAEKVTLLDADADRCEAIVRWKTLGSSRCRLRGEHHGPHVTRGPNSGRDYWWKA